MSEPHVSGGVRQMLRLEGFALLCVAVAAYAHMYGDWKPFALLFLAPDLCFIAYLFGPRVGAIAYNAVHSTTGPLALGLASVLLAQPQGLAIVLIWIAHIGFDRALGYGLKYASGFSDTHLGRNSRGHVPQSVAA
jgi:hypothetical protein